MMGRKNAGMRLNCRDVEGFPRYRRIILQIGLALLAERVHRSINLLQSTPRRVGNN